MANVAPPLKTAQEGLPAICAMTGGRADGAMPVSVGRTLTRWSAPEVRIPLAEEIFTQWSRRQNLHIKGRGVASLLTAVGVVLAFRATLPALAILAVAVAIHLVDLWAERSVKKYRPELKRNGTQVELRGVHDRFANALVEMGGEPLAPIDPSP